ncbi:micrococcal nuclease [Brachybacterium aquaticum]|uniref:Micrococcal nuclease n=1 Tax=Brachybacterium aquaticum TaxID=1432564 RepID=A0A841AGR4_9MICO|nr:micrococcal nuclease [Brachybacterium aquaticum]
MAGGKHTRGQHGAVGTGTRRGVLATLVAGVVVVGAVAAGAVGGIGGDGRGTVVRVVDGDTLIADIRGEETTIRLLNIDTPETKDPDQPVQCLGPEASEFLAERLPAGTEIELEYDQERTDRYGRTLAGVLESDSLVNAEIAAAGLGVPVLFEPNDRFLPEVEEAASTAQADGLGLFAADIACTIPAQIAEVAQAADGIPTTVEGDPAGPLAEAATVVEDADALVAGLADDGLPGLGNAVLAAPLMAQYMSERREEAGDVLERGTTGHERMQEAKTAYDEEQERLRKEKEERERREREERERQEREEREREEQEREEREERERKERERKAQQQPAASSSGSSSSGKSGGSSSGSSSGSSIGSSSGSGTSSGSSSSGSGSSGGSSSGKSSSGGSSGSSCVPYGPEILYSDDGGYTGKRYGMPGGKTFRKCS